MGPLRMTAAGTGVLRSGRFVLVAVAAHLSLQAGILPADAQAKPPQANTSESPEPENSAAASDSNPTQSVLFSPRLEYANLKDGNWTTALLLRSDRPFTLGKSAGGGRQRLILRLDVPIVTSNLGAGTDTGLGDLYGQVLYVPYLSRKFAFASGTGLFAPTAGQDSLGRGKWVLAPLVAPVWFFSRSRGFLLVKLQDNFSFAGDSDWADIHYTQATPTLLWRFAKRWWVLGSAESRTDWEDEHRTEFVSGLQLGRTFKRTVGGWVQLDVPLGGDQQVDYKLRFAVLWFRP